MHFFRIHFNQPVWNYQRPTCSAAPCAAANKSLPSSEGGEAACQPTNHPKAGPPFPKNNKRIGMVSLMRTYMFGRCLKLYFPEKKACWSWNWILIQGLQSPKLYKSVCLRIKSYDILNSAWCHGQPPPSLVGLLGIYLLGLGFCCSFRKFRSKDLMQS